MDSFVKDCGCMNECGYAWLCASVFGFICEVRNVRVQRSDIARVLVLNQCLYVRTTVWLRV